MEYEKNRRLYHDMNNHNLVMWKLAEKESMSVSINISETAAAGKRPAQAVDAEFDP